MDGQMTVVSNPTVNVRLTSTISSFEVQRRFNRGMTIADLKVRTIFIAYIPHLKSYTHWLCCWVFPHLNWIIHVTMRLLFISAFPVLSWRYQYLKYVIELCVMYRSVFILIRESWRWSWALLPAAWIWSYTVSLTSSCRVWTTTTLCWVPILWMMTAEYTYVAALCGSS